MGLAAGFLGASGFSTGDFGLSGASGSLGLGLAASLFGASGLPAGGGGGAAGFSLRGGGFRGGRTWRRRGFLGGLQAGGLAVGGGATRFLGAGARQSGVRLLLAAGGFGAGLACRDTLGFGLVPGNACRFFFLSGLILGRRGRFRWSRGWRLGYRWWGSVGGCRNGERQRGRFWSAWRWSVRRASRRGGRVGWSLPFFHQFRDENHGQRGNDGGADQALG